MKFRFFVFGFLLTQALTAPLACKGAQTTVDFSVRVSADACEEDRQAPVSQEFMTLTCPKVDGTGSVRIQFPRREWWSMKLHDAGKTDVPGK